MKKTLFALLLCSVAMPAHAQNAVTQSGTIVTNRPAKWIQDRRIGDAGGLTGDSAGRGMAPSSTLDSLGIGHCYRTDLYANAHNALCIGHDADGNGLFTLDSLNGFASKSLKFRINGSTYDWPSSGGNVLGPGTTTIGNFAQWNNTTGTLLADSGFSLTNWLFSNSDYAATAGGHFRTVKLTGTSSLQSLPSTGYSIQVQTSPGVWRSIYQVSTNIDQSATAPIRYLNCDGCAIGEDGDMYSRTNHIHLISTNGLRSSYAFASATTNASSQLTGVTITNPGQGGYSSADPPGIIYINPDGSLCNAVAPLTAANVDGSGQIIGPVTITDPGNNCSPLGVVPQIQSLPTDALDVGPQLNLIRDVATTNGSFLGAIMFVGKTAGGGNATYASFNSRVLSNDSATPTGQLYMGTACSFSTQAGNCTRAILGSGLFFATSAGGLKGDPGVGGVHAEFLQADRVNAYGASPQVDVTSVGAVDVRQRMIPGAAGRTVDIELWDAAARFRLAKTAANAFNIADVANSDVALEVTAAGQVTLGESGGTGSRIILPRSGLMRITNLQTVGAGTGKFFACFDANGDLYIGTGASCN